MEWWWSYRLNRRETMSWRVAAADMRAQEELLLACLLAVMVEERSLNGRMLGPWRAEIGMVEGNPFFASKKTQSFTKHSGIVEDDWSLGWKWEHYDRDYLDVDMHSTGQLFCTCTPGWRNWSFDRMKTIATSMGVLLDRAIMRWSSHLFLHCINKCYQVRHRFPLFWPAMDQRMLQIV